MAYLALMWLTIVIGAGLVVLFGMALEYGKHKTKGH